MRRIATDLLHLGKDVLVCGQFSVQAEELLLLLCQFLDEDVRWDKWWICGCSAHAEVDLVALCGEHGDVGVVNGCRGGANKPSVKLEGRDRVRVFSVSL